jgi:hypothetical protein
MTIDVNRDFARRIGMAAAWNKYGWPDLLPVPGNR